MPSAAAAAIATRILFDDEPGDICAWPFSKNAGLRMSPHKSPKLQVVMLRYRGNNKTPVIVWTDLDNLSEQGCGRTSRRANAPRTFFGVGRCLRRIMICG